MHRNALTKPGRQPDPQTPAEKRELRRFKARQAAERAYAESDEGRIETMSAKIRERVQACGSVSKIDMAQAGVPLCAVERLFESAMTRARAEDPALFVSA